MKYLRKRIILFFTALYSAFGIVFVHAQDHGKSVPLGTVTIAGNDFSITRYGELVPGKEGALSVELAKGDKKTLSTLNLYLWVEDEAGAQLNAPAKGTPEGDHLHFHVTPKNTGNPPKRVTLRVRKEGLDERGFFPLDGHGHEHAATPHEGMLTEFKDASGKKAGYIELKLHDDKGDLEAWLGKDEKLVEPFDISLTSTLKVTFIDVVGKTATLSVRNKENNEDEDGKGTIRNGKTNYFVFPGGTGQDASWLKGSEFQSIVKVSFKSGDSSYISDEFMLVPHTHSEGGHHH
jgi:hypothetical protein